MGTGRLRPAKWVRLASCSKQCSLNPEQMGDKYAQIVHGWYEQGLGDGAIGKNLFELGLSVSESTIARHRSKHMMKQGELTDQPLAEGEEGPELSDLEALDAILRQGSKQIGKWRVTPSDFFKAMDMKYKLTQGSVFQGMLEALAAAEEDDEEFEGMEEDEPGPGLLREVHAGPSATSGPSDVAERGDTTD